MPNIRFLLLIIQFGCISAQNVNYIECKLGSDLNIKVLNYGYNNQFEWLIEAENLANIYPLYKIEQFKNTFNKIAYHKSTEKYSLSYSTTKEFDAIKSYTLTIKNINKLDIDYNVIIYKNNKTEIDTYKCNNNHSKNNTESKLYSIKILLLIIMLCILLFFIYLIGKNRLVLFEFLIKRANSLRESYNNTKKKYILLKKRLKNKDQTPQTVPTSSQSSIINIAMQPIKPQKSADAFILIDKNCEGCKEIKECLDDRVISNRNLELRKCTITPDVNDAFLNLSFEKGKKIYKLLNVLIQDKK